MEVKIYKPKILIVDDQVDVCDILKRTLHLEGMYDITTVRSGRAAISRVKQDGFNIVILDIRMPDMDGLDVLYKIKKINPDIDVVIITAYGSLDSAVKSMKFGAYHYLLKPLNLEEIKIVVKNIVKKQKMNIELKKETDKIKTLYEISRLLLSNLEIDEMFKIILEKAINIIGADEGSLMIWDEEAKQLYVQISFGIPDDVAKEVRLKAGERIAGWVVEYKESVLIIGGLKNDPRFAHLDGQPDINSSISSPLIANDKVLGVICLNRTKTETNFTKEDLSLIEIFASDAAIAMQNAKLHQAMKEKK